jgi:putative membrane protein
LGVIALAVGETKAIPLQARAPEPALTSARSGDSDAIAQAPQRSRLAAKEIVMFDLDLSLAISHHLLIFLLFGVLVAELMLVIPGMNQIVVARVVAIDLWYGILAGLILAVGFSRAIFAAKGWAYYGHNLFFWAKLVTFVVIALVSVPPTIAYIRWKRANSTPSSEQIRAIRRYLWVECGLFALLPIFAATMARGYGEVGL